MLLIAGYFHLQATGGCLSPPPLPVMWSIPVAWTL